MTTLVSKSTFRVRAALCLLAAALNTPHTLYAQARPDAGQTLESVRPPPAVPGSNPGAALPPQDERPALSTPSDQRIPVRRWRITGAHAFRVDELQALVRDRVGKELTLSELNAAAARITAYYRQHGYLLSRAYLPAQDIREGELEIAVMEGRLAAVKVANASKVGASTVGEHIERLKTTGPVQGQALERALLLLSDLPGVEVRSTLKPGATVGTSDLDLQVRGTRRLNGSFDADSFGNRYTGALRAGGTLNVNSPFHRGDLFTLRANTAGSGMTYGRAAWQTPLGGNGLQAGVAWSDLRYELGKNFDSLDAHGTARVGTAWLGYALLRSQARNATVRLSYDDKRLNDRVDATASSSRKSLDVWTLGFTADRTDARGGGGVNSFQLDVISGRLSLDPLTAALDSGVGGHETEGRYGKLAYSLSRLQRLSDRLFLYAALNGQFSSKNLDSSETQSVGGVYGVRAYPQGEAVGADAAVLNLELRWGLPRMPELQALAFIDAGTVKVNHSPLATDTDNRRSLAGEGIGAQWIRPQHFALKAYVAWRSGPQPTSDIDRRPRFWLQFAQYF
jgi:hemolysin activation/secretion protein